MSSPRNVGGPGNPPEDSRLGKLFSSARSKVGSPGNTRWQKFTNIFKSAASKRQAGAERGKCREFRAEVWQAYKEGGATKAWDAVKRMSLDGSYDFVIAEESKKFTPAGRKELSIHRAAARDQQEIRSLKTWLGQIEGDYDKVYFLAQEGYMKTGEGWDEVTVEKPGAAAQEARKLCSNIMRRSGGRWGEIGSGSEFIQQQRTEAANSISSQVEERGVDQLDRDALNSHIATLKRAPRPYQYLPAIKQLEDQLAIATASYEKEQAQSAQAQLMERTGGQNTKESMYPLSITDIDGYLEKLRPYPQDDATVTALQECRAEKVGILSQVDRILGSRLAQGGTINPRDLLLPVSLLLKALEILQNNVQIPECSRVNIPILKARLAGIKKFTPPGGKLSDVGRAQQEARRAWAAWFFKATAPRWQHETRRAAAGDQQEARRAEEARGSQRSQGASGSHTSGPSQNLHRQLQERGYYSMSYVRQANCLRDILIEWNLVPEAKQGTLKVATKNNEARKLARRIFLFTHPDKNKKIDQDLGKALIELATAITKSK